MENFVEFNFLYWCCKVVCMVFRADTSNNGKVFNFTYSFLYAFGKCLIDIPKIFIFGVYFSAPAVRIFLFVAQWKGPRGTSKFCKWFSQNILVCSKWDILGPKMTCVSGSAAPATSFQPQWWKTQGSLKRILSKKKWRKLSRNYTPNWKNCWLEETYFWKFPPTVTSGRTIKDEKGQQVHENFIKGDSAWKLY